MGHQGGVKGHVLTVNHIQRSMHDIFQIQCLEVCKSAYSIDYAAMYLGYTQPGFPISIFLIPYAKSSRRCLVLLTMSDVALW